MVKACLQIFGRVKPVGQESRGKKAIGWEGDLTADRESRRRKVVVELEPNPTLSWDVTLNSKDISVRIVHAGGRQELYSDPVPAYQVMKKYPGMCIARPDVFKHPHQSLIWPEEKLVPGQKYYVIPSSTLDKLRRKHGNSDPRRRRQFQTKVEVKEIPPARGEISDRRLRMKKAEEEEEVEEEEDSEDSFSSAKAFYGRGSTSYLRGGLVAKKPFVPPLPQSKISQSMNWEPSLDSVQEISP